MSYTPLASIVSIVLFSYANMTLAPAASTMIGVSYVLSLFHACYLSTSLNAAVISLYSVAYERKTNWFLNSQLSLTWIFLALTLFFRAINTFYTFGAPALTEQDHTNFAIIYLVPVSLFNIALLPLYFCAAPLASSIMEVA